VPITKRVLNLNFSADQFPDSRKLFRIVSNSLACLIALTSLRIPRYEVVTKLP
jgi:hypothetical protein